MVFFWLILGFILVVKGADFFVDGSVVIAKRFKIPQMIIGLTIVSIGTSLPEIIISVIAAFQSSTELAIGVVVGSNNFNTLFILGLSALMAPFVIKYKTISRDLWLSLISSIVLLGVNFAFTQFIPRWVAVLLGVTFTLYILSLIKEVKQLHEVEEILEPEEEMTVKEMMYKIIFGIIGCGMIIFGSDIAVKAAADIAIMFGISERVVGLTIIAIGTSLPEFITTLVACKKGENDIALGNILGSNIFHNLLMLGLVGIINPLVVNTAIVLDLGIFIAACLMLLWFIKKNEKVGRFLGAVLCGMYTFYVFLILLTMH